MEIYKVRNNHDLMEINDCDIKDTRRDECERRKSRKQETGVQSDWKASCSKTMSCGTTFAKKQRWNASRIRNRNDESRWKIAERNSGMHRWKPKVSWCNLKKTLNWRSLTCSWRKSLFGWRVWREIYETCPYEWRWNVSRGVKIKC